MQIKPYLLLCFLFLFSCAQENKEEVLKKSPPIGEPIKGEPIVSDSLDSNQTEPTLNKDLLSIEPDKRTDLGETIEEGLVINGVRKPQDENSTQPTIINNLPPLEENSGYERLDFRDLVNSSNYVANILQCMSSGQLISKCHFGVFKSPKKPTNDFLP